MDQTLYEIYVGNMGKILSTFNFNEANFTFWEYMILSKAGYDRCNHEEVTWFKNGEVYKEYIPTISEEII